MLDRFGQRQQQLLTLLLRNKVGLTIDAIVDSLGVSKTAVYQHTASLERDGYIEKHVLAKTGGRPGHTYILTDQGMHVFPKQYAWFSELLLTYFKEKLGSKGLANCLHELGEHLAEGLQSRLAGKPPYAQVMEVVDIMQELGFEANAVSETSNELPTITACNCVYHDLASEHREVCELDLALLSKLLGREIEHLECMVRGGTMCRFKVGETLRKLGDDG